MTDKTDIDNVRYSLDAQEFFQRQIEELYGVQLSGQETIAELIEMVRRLRNEEN